MHKRLHVFLLLSLLAILGWSAVRPHDYLTWWMEVAPVLIALPIFLKTYARFTFTPLVYTLIWAHGIILIIGGHYTYAEMPVFNWIRDTFGLARNYYDRLGHLAQGFVPAMVAREILIRKEVVRGRGWLFAIVVCMCLALSACYEFVEWWAALALGSGADAFLATQGDVWDTQWDMFCALIGAVAAQLLLARRHGRQLEKA
jgi:putative membrane protein